MARLDVDARRPVADYRTLCPRLVHDDDDDNALLLCSQRLLSSAAVERSATVVCIRRRRAAVLGAMASQSVALRTTIGAGRAVRLLLRRPIDSA